MFGIFMKMYGNWKILRWRKKDGKRIRTLEYVTWKRCSNLMLELINDNNNNVM